MKKYLSTIGLNVVINNRVKLARVSFTIKDDCVTAHVVSGNTLSPIRKIKKLTMTRDAFNELDYDYYNEVVFAKSAFGLFGLSV